MERIILFQNERKKSFKQKIKKSMSLKVSNFAPKVNHLQKLSNFRYIRGWDMNETSPTCSKMQYQL